MLRQRKRRLQKMMAAILMAAGFVFVKAQPPEKPQNSTTRKMASATELIENGELAAAEILIKQVIAAEPRNDVAQTLAGVVADRRNDLPAAEKHFAIAAELQPNSSAARNNYGAILFRLGRGDEAVKEFEASLKANPNQPSAQINLAQIYFAKGTSADLRTARMLFEKVFAAAPDVEIARALVVIALRLGENDRAAEDYRRYAVLAEKAALPATARLELGASLLEVDLYSEALSEAQSIIKSEPNNVSAIVLRSKIYLAQKNIKAAGQTLEAAVARGVDEAKIYAALADVYMAGGYVENAIPAMRLAIERDPRSEEYRYRYGMLLIDTKTPAAAVIRLKEAAAEFPQSARLRLGLGIAQFYVSQLIDARQSLGEALKINPKIVPAFAYLAAIDNINGQAAAAAANYERALAIDEKNAILNFLLADTLLKDATADVGKIEKHLKRAIELDGQIAAAHFALGKLYARQKRFAEAVVALEKADSLEPNRVETVYQLAQVYSKLKRADEAQATLLKFKELSEREKTQTKNDYSELVRRLANVNF